MMKTIKNSLAVLAFAAASLSAFAFSPQGPDPDKTLFANNNGNWVALPSGASVTCLSASTICVAQFEDDIPGQQMTYQREGRYVQ